MVGLVVPLEVGLDRAQQFLSHVGWISHNRVKPTALEDARELCLPVEGFGVDRWIIHHAIAAADVGGQVRQWLARAGGADPERELGDLH